MNGNIYLTGFMGSGKSSVGKILADNLGRKFIDMDKELVKRFKCSINKYFNKHGEEAFRDQETTLLKELCCRKRLIVATGGGIVMREKNRLLMQRSGDVIFLKTKLDDCASRLGKKGKSSRPMWNDHGKTQELFFKRAPFYAEADITVDTHKRVPEAIADRISREVYPDHNFSVRMEGIECPVACSFNSLDMLCSAISGRKVAILTDRKVAKLHLPRYLKGLNEETVVELSGGEKIKSLRTAEKVYRLLLDKRFNRDDLLIAIGGGTVTDLGAYIAATYKRGMPFILASTTLLGCVDAAVGGKSAVNLGNAKNIIGCFTIPELVVLDAGSFKTLSKNSIADGLIEAYKTGLIDNTKISSMIEENSDAMLNHDAPLLKEVAALSARSKAKVVSGDFREAGRRAILNFGHTYGHAVEGFYKYKVSHGNAVALGIIVATLISRNRKYLSEAESTQIIDTIKAICPDLPDTPPMEDTAEIMSHDKKIKKGRCPFVLLEKPGTPIIVNDLRTTELRTAVKQAKKETGK